jgi:hypothetical protein
MSPVIEINESIIEAVPAVHYRSAFAREVNNLCSCDKTRPEAVAVELGPHLTNAITSWMKELGVSPLKETELPCMLGLLYKNKFVHPDYQETALGLQAHSGKPLNELSPELRRKLLNYSDKYLAGLSSTDSIFEAIRCSIELNIPVYGIDMDEFSARHGKTVLIEEPQGLDSGLSNYVVKYGRIASMCRDAYVDGRREYVMAARLKSLAGRHRRILFTCGLAHWEMIQILLKDPAVRPAEILITEGSINFTRVIVHPRMAVTFMDTYPVLTTIYEQNRHNPLNKSKDPFRIQKAGHIYQDILAKVYNKYFKEYKTVYKENKTNNNIQRIPDFEIFVSNMQIVNQHFAPSLTDLIDCARSMMSPDFCDLLTTHLMDIERPWASPGQFPNLPMVSRLPDNSEQKENKAPVDFFNLTESVKDLKHPKPSVRKRSGSFTLDYRNANPVPEYLLRMWNWEDEPVVPRGRESCYDWVWPPCEAILFGSAYEASKMAVTRSNEPVSAVFEGSLFDGLDIKATIRSATAGEKKIYIRKPSSTRKTFYPDGKKPEPTVFIFENTPTDIKSTWSLLIAGTNLRRYLKDKTGYDKIVAKYGGYFISSISRISYHAVPSEISRYVVSYSILEGITAFGSPCINAMQGAQWLEDNNFRACPVLTYTSIDTLIDYYKNQHNMEISETDWKTAMIRFAIPFAKERVVVVAPGNFKVSNKLHSEAGKRNVSIDQIPLSYFPAERIAEMKQRLIVRAKDNDGLTFPPEAEQALGQKADKYLELLPLYMQQQLKRK